MEIQSFILCAGITPTAGGRIKMFDGQVMGIRSFFPNPGYNYPVHHPLPFYILLRREHKDYDEQCSLRFDLVDLDGRQVGAPKGEKFKTIFPAGERFLQFTGTVPLELPAPGDYRLDITADEEGRPFVYAYNIEATEKPDNC
jgi:hypothetical protein